MKMKVKKGFDGEIWVFEGFIRNGVKRVTPDLCNEEEEIDSIGESSEIRHIWMESSIARVLWDLRFGSKRVGRRVHGLQKWKG